MQGTVGGDNGNNDVDSGARVLTNTHDTKYPSKTLSEGPSLPSISSQPSMYVSESNRPTIYTADIDYCKFKLENANARERVLEIVNSTESQEGQVHKTSSKTVSKTTFQI